MGKEFNRKTEDSELEKVVEAVTDDLVEIDPAEFFDPEEFGIRRHARP